MRRVPRRALLAAAAACALSACGGAAPGADGPLRVVTTSYPLEFVAREVAGDRAAVSNLVPPGAASHGLEPGPQQVGELAGADVVVHLSGMQHGVDEALQQQRPQHLVDAARAADLPGDPHFWLDPLRLASVADDVADELAAVDPAGAADYAGAAQRLRAELEELDGEYAAALAGCAGATLVTAHEAFAYLADRHGLEQVGISGLDPHVEPPPSRVRDVVDVVRERGVRTIFFEATANPAVAETLAADLGVTTAVLHPVERVQRGQDYPTLMRENLRALRTGLDCTGG